MTEQEIADALSAPFDAKEVGCRVGSVTKDKKRCIPLWYIDARNVFDRLTRVVGLAGWQDAYDVLPNGNVVCRLSVRIAGGWVTRVDVGGQSDQDDAGDKCKAAFSDALKRAAVKFGVGRYLYEIPNQWVDYDEQRRQFIKPPTLPAWALPKRARGQVAPAPPAATATMPAAANGKLTPGQLAVLKSLRGRLGLTDADVTKRCEVLGFKPGAMTVAQADRLSAALEACHLGAS
jgi:hypothetical protein